jgi:CheY-like chemotaxis protein
MNGPDFGLRTAKKKRQKTSKKYCLPITDKIELRHSSKHPIIVTEKDKILVVSHDPRLADVRRKVLEKAGFEVLAASDSTAIKRTCAVHKPRLVMMGYSLLPSEKRRVWAAVKEHCDVPVLELHRKSGPELLSTDFSHESLAPDDFLATVMKILVGGRGN